MKIINQIFGYRNFRLEDFIINVNNNNLGKSEKLAVQGVSGVGKTSLFRGLILALLPRTNFNINYKQSFVLNYLDENQTNGHKNHSDNDLRKFLDEMFFDQRSYFGFNIDNEHLLIMYPEKRTTYQYVKKIIKCDATIFQLELLKHINSDNSPVSITEILHIMKGEGVIEYDKSTELNQNLDNFYSGKSKFTILSTEDKDSYESIILMLLEDMGDNQQNFQKTLESAFTHIMKDDKKDPTQELDVYHFLNKLITDIFDFKADDDNFDNEFLSKFKDIEKVTYELETLISKLHFNYDLYEADYIQSDTENKIKYSFSEMNSMDNKIKEDESLLKQKELELSNIKSTSDYFTKENSQYESFKNKYKDIDVELHLKSLKSKLENLNNLKTDSMSIEKKKSGLSQIILNKKNDIKKKEAELDILIEREISFSLILGGQSSYKHNEKINMNAKKILSIFNVKESVVLTDADIDILNNANILNISVLKSYIDSFHIEIKDVKVAMTENTKQKKELEEYLKTLKIELSGYEKELSEIQNVVYDVKDIGSVEQELKELEEFKRLILNIENNNSELIKLRERYKVINREKNSLNESLVKLKENFLKLKEDYEKLKLKESRYNSNSQRYFYFKKTAIKVDIESTELIKDFEFNLENLIAEITTKTSFLTKLFYHDKIKNKVKSNDNVYLMALSLIELMNNKKDAREINEQNILNYIQILQSNVVDILFEKKRYIESKIKKFTSNLEMKTAFGGSVFVKYSLDDTLIRYIEIMKKICDQDLGNLSDFIKNNLSDLTHLKNNIHLVERIILNKENSNIRDKRVLFLNEINVVFNGSSGNLKAVKTAFKINLIEKFTKSENLLIPIIIDEILNIDAELRDETINNIKYDGTTIFMSPSGFESPYIDGVIKFIPVNNKYAQVQSLKKAELDDYDK